MQLKIDFGLRSYELADPEGNVLGTLRFNPSDPGLAARWQDFAAAVEKVTAQPPDTPAAMRALDADLKQALDAVFAAPVSAVLFQGQSCFALCGDGSFVLEHILDALAPVITEAIQTATDASARRVAQHTAAYDHSDRGLAPGQAASGADRQASAGTAQAAVESGV